MPPPRKSTAAPAAIVVMGVSGSGKTSVGERLSARLGLPFHDSDAFHPRANVDKMSSGVALTDDDRWPWLDAIGTALHDAEGGIIVACSALRRVYRDRLRTTAARPLIFVHLAGSRHTIGERLRARKGHFMPPRLLASQFATLEPPADEESVITVSIESPVDDVVAAIVAALAAAPQD